MKRRSYSVSDYLNSKELFQTNPPAVLSTFIYLVLAIFLATLAFCIFARIEIVVKATGIIRPASSISVVKSKVSGTIVNVYYKNEDDIKSGDLLIVIDTSPFDAELKSTAEQISKAKNDIESYTLLKKSITLGKNFLTKSNTEFYNKYVAYVNRKNQLNMEYSAERENYEINKLLPAGSISKQELKLSESRMLSAKSSLDIFESETNVQLEEEIKSCQEKITQLAEKVNSIKFNIANCCIKAPISGKAQVLVAFNPGDVLVSGTDILRIIPQGKDLKVEISVSNNDIIHIKPGDKIRYNFMALPNIEYGFIEGKVTSVSSDVTTIQQGVSPSYRVEGDLDKTTIFTADNRPVDLKLGMFCEARIVVQEKSIIRFILEKLDFIARGGT